jgi:FkbM family methyltransferase
MDLMAYRAGTQDELMIQEVINENCYALPKHFKVGDTVIDIGAHIGCFSAMCLKRGVSRVVAVEPDPESLIYLHKNIGEDRRACIIEKAIWRQGAGKKKLVQGGKYSAMSRVAETGTVDVDTISLDEILLGEKKCVRILKMDCEGAEWPAIYTSEALQVWPPQEIIMELHFMIPTPPFECHPIPMVYHLEDLGYSVTLLGGKVPQVNGMIFARRR